VRILICASQAPVPPLSGSSLPLFHLCEQLAQRHEVTVIGYAGSDAQGTPPAGVNLVRLPLPGASESASARSTLRALLLRKPRAVAALSPPMSDAVGRLLNQRAFDIVHVADSSLADVASAVGNTPRILAALDAWHLNIDATARLAPAYQRPLYRLQARNIRRFEASAYRRFQRVVVVSKQDAEALRGLDPQLELEVIPNGVDAAQFEPNRDVQREEGLVVFTGVMHWPPNVEAARFLATRVLPRLRAQLPAARVALVGREPSPAVRELAAIDGVEVTGEVSDVRPWLWRAQAFACPMVSGTGIKNKLLEALACGAPCVATPLACQGTGIAPGEQALIAESEQGIADALAAVLTDDGLRGRLGRAGRQHVVSNYSWGRVARDYEHVYEEALAAGPPGQNAQP